MVGGVAGLSEGFGLQRDHRPEGQTGDDGWGSDQVVRPPATSGVVEGASRDIRRQTFGQGLAGVRSNRRGVLSPGGGLVMTSACRGDLLTPLMPFSLNHLSSSSWSARCVS